MKKNGVSDGSMRDASQGQSDGQPLVAALISTAIRRGHRLGQLAKELGVTYERLAQWRRRPKEMASASADVYERAAMYLGVPTALAMVMGGQIRLNHLVWPTTAPLADRVTRALERLRNDSFLGGFVPEGLLSATPDVQLFVLFLYEQINGQGAISGMGLPWANALHQVVTSDWASGGNSEGAAGLTSGGDKIF